MRIQKEKGYTQHCLLIMLEKWKLAVDKNKAFGALFADLSKAFVYLNHDLLIAKLQPDKFIIDISRLSKSQITKVDNVFSK